MKSDLIRESLMQLNDFPNYYVSNLGEVYRKKSNGTYRRLKPYMGGSNRGRDTKGKYKVVCLYENSTPYRKYVHQLVLEAFQGPRPLPHWQACHTDGDRMNNTSWSLRWDTPEANREDKKRHRMEREEAEALATLKGASMDKMLKEERDEQK